MPRLLWLAYPVPVAYLLSMSERTNIPTDFISVLAFIFGAAVIVPSMISLALTLMAVADIAF